MTKLTSAQQSLLQTAAQNEDSAIDVAGLAKPTIWSLIKRGFVIAQDDGARLAITDAGRAAIAGPGPDAPTEEEASPPIPLPKGKTGLLVDLMRQPGGSTIEAMMAATGWQAHSVRGAIAGAIKKTLGLEVASTKTEAGRVYRVMPETVA